MKATCSFDIIVITVRMCKFGLEAEMSDLLLLGTNGIIVLFVLLFLFGIVIGSFLNVLIYRIPLKEDIAVERSHCMHCGHVLSWYELIPLFSYIIQGGKCRSCKKHISIQYPLVEALNAILWMGVVCTNGLKVETILFCLCSSVLIVLAVIDERTKEIPLPLNITIFILGVARVCFDYSHWYEYIIGMLVVSGLFFLIVALSKGRAMGMGDVKLMFAAGLLLGWKHILLAMILGCALGSVIHLIRMRVQKKNSELAFGPYLAMGIYLTFIVGQPIINWYMGLFRV